MQTECTDWETQIFPGTSCPTVPAVGITFYSATRKGTSGRSICGASLMHVLTGYSRHCIDIDTPIEISAEQVC